MDRANPYVPRVANVPWGRIAAGPALTAIVGVVHARLGGLGVPPIAAAGFYATTVMVASSLGGARSAWGSAILALGFLAGIGIPARGVPAILPAAAVVAAAWAAGLAFARPLTVSDQRAVGRRVVERYRTLFDDLGAIVWEFDLLGRRVVFVSASIERILGRPVEAWMESPTMWLDAQHPDDRSVTGDALTHMTGGATDLRFEHRMRAADGRTVWLKTAVRLGRGDNGSLVARGVSIDVSAYKQAGQDLRRALSLVSATLESTVDGMLVVDLEGRITSFNRRFIEMWGLPEDVIRSGDDEQAIAAVLDQLAHPEAFLAKVQELYADVDATSSDVIVFKDGRVFERYSQPQRIDGTCVGRVWSFHDVTERTRAEQAVKHHEEQLRQFQKMEAVGQLAGGVAHDFNNILTAVLGNVSLILEESTHPALIERAQDIEAAAQRAAALTRQLLAFSRRQMLELRVLDLNAVLDSMHKLLSVTLGASVQLETHAAPTPCPVRVDRSQIEQVMLNLALNARDAMPRGGRLTVTTAVTERSGRHVMLTVSDTGVGMDSGTMARVFEPFFTTKERGKGTGLGLATAYGIVRQLGGSISVRSSPGVGATFEIELPYCDQPLDELEPGDSPGKFVSRPRSESLLVVEDEPAVRRLMCETLVRAGFQVAQADSGVEALSVVGEMNGPLHLLVTDVVMPGMSGPELAERLMAARPGLRVLFITGYAETEIVRKGSLEPGVTLLQKPFSGDVLVQRIQQILDEPAA